MTEARILKTDRIIHLCRNGYITEEKLKEVLKKMEVEDVWAAFDSNVLTNRTDDSILLFNCYLQYVVDSKENIEALLNFTLTTITGNRHEKHMKAMREKVKESRYFKEVLKDWEIEIDS